MDTPNVRASRELTRVPDEIQQEATQQASHSPDLGPIGLAMSVRLQNHFEAHLETEAGSDQPAAPASSARNAELTAIRDDRAQRLEAGAITSMTWRRRKKTPAEPTDCLRQ